MGSRVQSTIGCFPELCFLQFSVAQVLVWLRKQLINNFVSPTWACAAGFNNNYNKNNRLTAALMSQNIIFSKGMFNFKALHAAGNKNKLPVEK